MFFQIPPLVFHCSIAYFYKKIMNKHGLPVNVFNRNKYRIEVFIKIAGIEIYGKDMSYRQKNIE